MKQITEQDVCTLVTGFNSYVDGNDPYKITPEPLKHVMYNMINAYQSDVMWAKVEAFKISEGAYEMGFLFDDEIVGYIETASQKDIVKSFLKEFYKGSEVNNVIREYYVDTVFPQLVGE